MKPVLIDTAAAAVELGVSVRTVCRLVTDDRLLTNYGQAGDIRLSLREVMDLGKAIGDTRQPRRALRRLRALAGRP